MSTSRQGGFTLIELVVVIVILGILAAFAVPRFMGMDREARVAALNGLGGSLRGSAAMAHGVWLARNSPAGAINIEGQNITFVNGYPDRNTIDNTIQSLVGFTQVVGANNVQFQKTGAPDVTQCYVQYTEAANPMNPPVIGNPVVGGC